MHKKSKHLDALTQIQWNDLYKQESSSIKNRVEQLRKILRKWDQSHDQIEEIPKTDEALMKLYFHKLAHYTSETRFMTFKENKNIHDQMIKELDDIDDAYIHFMMFHEAKWTLVLSRQIAQEIEDKIVGEDNLKTLMTKLGIYMQGYIPINSQLSRNENFLSEIESSQWKCCRYFLDNTPHFSLFLSMGYQKLPKLEYGKENFENFMFCPFIEILGVFTEEPQRKQMDYILEKSQEYYKNNPSKNLSEQKLEEDVVSKQKLGKKVQFFSYQKQSEEPQLNTLIQKRHPVPYKPKKIIQEEQGQQYIFQLKSFEEFKENFEKKKIYEQEQDESKKNQKIVQYEKRKQFFSFSSSKSLINVYNQIPNKIYKLTKDEENIVTLDENMIVIGRSGTGKTLCALLRLYVIEFFFKARETLRLSNEKRPLEPADIDRVIGLKNVFLTASPYLIKQIKKQYDEMIEHLKAILMEKSVERKNKKLQKGQLADQEDDGTFGQNAQLFKDQLDVSGLDQLIEQFEQKIQRMKNLNDLDEKDYPGFFSIRKFVQMIDGTLQNPMFYNKNQTNRQYTNPQLKDYEKKSQKKQKNEDKFNEKMQQSKQNLQFQEKQKQNDSNNDDTQNVGWIEEQKKENHRNDDKDIQKNEQKIEVTYDVFAKQFWPEVPKAYFKVQKQLAPANIWSQIYSVIKGSYQSHKSHTKYLSKAQYLKLTKKQIDEQIEYKKVVYQIFEYYQNWKQKTDHYDFMDLVNHILSDIDVYGYQGPMLNYLFVDEVQDLPPATMYLVSKIVTNAVFYCGDSAQTIAKGVNFKFGDIPKMFHDKFVLDKISLSSPIDLQLTVNFRSHNQILQLGHSVITIIQKLFPGSIDKLKSESSSFRGPVPMILTEIDQVKLLSILTEQITDLSKMDPNILNDYQQHAPDSKIFKLGPQQIILVRNEEEKRNLPYRLKQGVVLTFEDVKGLQYDDVVLVNFFSSSRYSDQWRLLKYLEVQYEQVKKEIYEEQLKSKQDTKGHHLQDDKSILRSFDWSKNMPEPIQKKDGYYYKVPTLTSSKDIKGENIKQFYELLTQLKILYTAITRARKNFIIYESSIPKYLQRNWLKLKSIRQINDQNFSDIKKEIHEYRRIHKNKNYQNEEKAWRKEGFKWYIRKNYEQAIRCFKNIPDLETAKRIEAEMFANEAAVQLRRIRNQQRNPDNLSKQEFKIKKKMLEAKKAPINKKFLEAGKMFEDIGRIKNAGQCYFSGENYEKALQCFKKSKFTRGYAQCCQILNLFEEAGQSYQKLKKYEKMLECFEKSENVKKIYEKLLKHLSQFPQSQEMCIKYGKIILHYRVKHYLSQNQNLHISWKALNPARYTSNSQSQSTKNIKRYLLFETMKNVQKVVETKIRIEILQKKLLPFQKQVQQLNTEIKKIEKEFETLQPYRSLKQAQIFYDLRQQEIIYKKTKPFAETCIQYKIRQQDAIKVAQNFKNIREIYLQINNKINSLKSELNKINDDKLAIEKKYGQTKELDAIMIKLKRMYDLNKFEGFERDQKIDISKIDTKKILYEEKKNYQNQVMKDFQKLQEKFVDQQDLEINSFLDQSFESQYSMHRMNNESRQYSSMSMLEKKTDILKGFIFNFSINRQDVGELIFKSKDIVQKMKKYLHNPLKPPFTDQHHLIIDAKIQSIICQLYPQFEDIVHFLRRIERIGQDQLALLTCEFYQLDDLAKKFIISKIVKANKMFGKSKKVQKITYLEGENEIQPSSTISQFLNRINPDYLRKQCFRTLSSKQKIINSIVECLLIQGMYRNAFEFIKQNTDQKVKLSYIFMNYKQLYENLLGRMTNKLYKFKESYLFLSEKKYGIYAVMINSASIQQLFYLYDKIQENPFLSQINWKQSVKMDDQKVKQLAKIISTKMKQKQEQIALKKDQLEKKRKYVNSQLPQRQFNQRKQQINLINNAKKQYFQKIEQRRALQNLIQQKIQQSEAMRNAIKQLNTQKKKIQSTITQKNQRISRLEQLKKLLEMKQNEFQIEYTTYFYEMNQFQNFVNRFEKESENKQTEIFQPIHPTITISYNLTNLINQLYDQLFQMQSQRLQIAKEIQKNEYNIPRTTNQINQYRQEVTSKTFQYLRIIEILQKYQNMPQNHKEQTQREKQYLNTLNKQIRQLEKQLSSLEDKIRKKYFDQQEKKIIVKNKLKYRQKITPILKNCWQLPPQYQNGYFSLFLQLRQENVAQRNQTWEFKQKLQKVIQNSMRNFNQLDTFQKCEAMILFLSIICYPQKNNIFQYLIGQKIDEERKQLNIIKGQIRELQNRINHIDWLKNHEQGGYYTSIQQRQIKIYEDEINKLAYRYNNIGRNNKAFSSTYSKLREMLQKMFYMSDQIRNEADLHFVELMLGFFQCRVVRNCPLLWFLENQYVVVKSDSVLVKTVLSKNLNSLYCYYFDDNKEFVIMKFQNAYLSMKNLIRDKYKSFVYQMKFWQEYNATKQSKKYRFRDIRDFGKYISDEQGLNLLMRCNPDNQKQLRYNYDEFRFRRIQKRIQKHKQNILRYYFENGFKTAETFHFLHYQLKVLHENYQILQETKEFSNLMIKDILIKINNLESQFQKWKNFIYEQKQITKKSCEDQQQKENEKQRN